MKKLGLIGGTGPESILVYYRELNRLINEETEGSSFPELALESVNLYKALEYCAEENYEALETYPLNAVENLAKCGEDMLAVNYYPFNFSLKFPL